MPTKTLYLPNDAIQNRLRDVSLYIRHTYPDGVVLISLSDQCNQLIQDFAKQINKRGIKVDTDSMLCQLDPYDSDNLIITKDLAHTIKNKNILILKMSYYHGDKLLCLAKKTLSDKGPNKLHDFVLLYKLNLINRTDMCDRKVSYYGFYYTDNVSLRGYGIENDTSPDIYIK